MVNFCFAAVHASLLLHFAALVRFFTLFLLFILSVVHVHVCWLPVAVHPINNCVFKIFTIAFT